MHKNSKIILGVDPGTLAMGYSLIEVHENKMQVLTLDVLKLHSKTNMYERLRRIHVTMYEIITKYKPQELAIEAPFFGKNVQSMLKLGRAQGIAIAVAMQFNLPVTEYSPRKVKQSITGNGNAGKEQVWKMLQQMFVVPTANPDLDASDALAVAVCHHFQEKKPAGLNSNKIKGWEDYIRKHPDRVIVVK